jgi:hypothetical protein
MPMAMLDLNVMAPAPGPIIPVPNLFFENYPK